MKKRALEKNFSFAKFTEKYSNNISKFKKSFIKIPRILDSRHLRSPTRPASIKTVDKFFKFWCFSD